MQNFKSLIYQILNKGGKCTEIVGEDLGLPSKSRSLQSDLFTSATTLYWPFEYRPVYITQAFGGTHKGLDIGIPNGTRLYSPFPVRSQIVRLGWDNSGYGIMVSLKNDAYGLYVILGHMEKVSPDLRVGAWVEPFAFLGWSDNTGNSTGPHLHLEVRSGSGYYPYPSSCINPRPMLVWYSQAPSPQPPPKPNPSPPPIPPPTPVGWYKARTTQEIRLYTKQKFNTMVNYPRIAVGYDLMVSDRKQNGSEKWVILENGYFTLKRNGSQIYLRKV